MMHVRRNLAASVRAIGRGIRGGSFSSLRLLPVLPLLLLFALSPSPSSAQPWETDAKWHNVPRVEALLPAPDTGIEFQGGQAIYMGEELYEHLNGGAQLFLEFGFREIGSQELLFRGHHYVWEVYQMVDPLAAYGVFSIRRPLQYDADLSLEGFPFSGAVASQAFFAYGPYYAELISFQTVPDMKREMTYIAHAALDRLGPDLAATDLLSQPPFDALPPGRVAASERLARGSVGLRASLRHAGSQDFRRAMEGALEADSSRAPLWVIAEYHSPEETAGKQGGLQPRTTLLIHRNADHPTALMQAARRAFTQNPAEMMGITLLDGVDGWLVVPPDRDPDPPTPAAARAQSAWFVGVKGSDLWMGVSTIKPDELSAWAIENLRQGAE